MRNEKHVCKDYFCGCTCSVIADEPADDCDVHGAGHWPPRCECGKFVKRELVLVQEILDEPM